MEAFNDNYLQSLKFYRIVIHVKIAARAIGTIVTV